jgi:hypothetical protein
MHSTIEPRTGQYPIAIPKDFVAAMYNLLSPPEFGNGVFLHNQTHEKTLINVAMAFFLQPNMEIRTVEGTIIYVYRPDSPDVSIFFSHATVEVIMTVTPVHGPNPFTSNEDYARVTPFDTPNNYDQTIRRRVTLYSPLGTESTPGATSFKLPVMQLLDGTMLGASAFGHLCVLIDNRRIITGVGVSRYYVQNGQIREYTDGQRIYFGWIVQTRIVLISVGDLTETDVQHYKRSPPVAVMFYEAKNDKYYEYEDSNSLSHISSHPRTRRTQLLC